MPILSVRRENVPHNRSKNGLKKHKNNNNSFKKPILLSPNNNSVINFSFREHSKDFRWNSGNKTQKKLSTNTQVLFEDLVQKLEHLIFAINRERRRNRKASTKLRFVALCIIPGTVYLSQILKNIDSTGDVVPNSCIGNKFLFLFDILVEFIWVDCIKRLCSNSTRTALKDNNYQVRYLPQNKEFGDALQVEIINKWKRMSYFSPALLASLKFIVVGNSRAINEYGYEVEIKNIVFSTLLIEVKNCYTKFMVLLTKYPQLNKEFDRSSFFLLLEWLVKGTIQSNAGESIVGLNVVINNWIKCQNSIVNNCTTVDLKEEIRVWATKFSSKLLECKLKDDMRAQDRNKQTCPGDEQVEIDLVFNKYEIAHLFLDELLHSTSRTEDSRQTEDSQIKDEDCTTTGDCDKNPLWMSIFRDSAGSVETELSNSQEMSMLSLTVPSEFSQSKGKRFNNWIHRHKTKIYQKLREAFRLKK